MIYYALVKIILNDSEFFKSFDIAVSFVTDDLDTLTLECLNYEHDVGPSYPYDFKHPGGTIAIDRAYGRFSVKETCAKPSVVLTPARPTLEKRV